MRFRPRHYVLIVVILALGAWNFSRTRHVQQQPPPASPTRPIVPGNSPAWPVFDSAAALRDAPDDKFQPALKTLAQTLDSSNKVNLSPPTSREELTALNGCRTWLLFYRQEHLHPSNRPGWLDQLQNHVNSCVAHHQDVAL